MSTPATGRRRTDSTRSTQPGEQAQAPIPRDHVARRAYERFLERGGNHGSDVDDWLEAERELLASHQS